jgi:DNA-binding XRE family transcriptional regulator
MFNAHEVVFGMRPSGLKHALAVLRVFLGMRQKELAELVGRSTRTIQAVEVGPLVLSESLAREISAKTGASLDWLMRNDVDAPIVDTEGKPYTKETYERARAGEFNITDGASAYLASNFSIGEVLARVCAAYFLAQDHGGAHVGVLNYRLGAALDKALDGFMAEQPYKLWHERLEAVQEDDEGDYSAFYNSVLADYTKISTGLLKCGIEERKRSHKSSRPKR